MPIRKGPILPITKGPIFANPEGSFLPIRKFLYLPIKNGPNPEGSCFANPVGSQFCQIRKGHIFDNPGGVLFLPIRKSPIWQSGRFPENYFFIIYIYRERDFRDPKAYVHESDIHTEEYKDFRNWTLELHWLLAFM